MDTPSQKVVGFQSFKEKRRHYRQKGKKRSKRERAADKLLKDGSFLPGFMMGLITGLMINRKD